MFLRSAALRCTFQTPLIFNQLTRHCSEVSRTSESSIPFRRIKKINNKEYLETFEKLGSDFVLDTGSDHLDVIDGIGMVQPCQHADGRLTFIVLPATVYHKKPLPLKNLKYNDEILRHNFNQTEIRSVEWQAFSLGLPGITKECLKSSSYYFEDGFRKVRPYYMQMERMVTTLPRRTTILEVVKGLLPHHSDEMIKFRIEQGLIQVNFERRVPNDEVSVGDFVTSILHYHESPVLDEPIETIFENDEILVVNKPPSYLIYPSSSQRFNSLMFVLAKEKGHLNIRPIHRLDKNTSGVCIFSKSTAVTRKLQAQFKTPGLNHRKEYLAMVDGSFPETEVTLDEPLAFSNTWSTFVGKDMEAKASTTTFRRLSYDGRSSLVHCIPKTGRTHQIRLHLQTLGYPIVNDYLYNPEDEKVRLEIDSEGISSAVQRILARHMNSCNSSTSDILENGQDEDWRAKLSAHLGSKDPNCITCELGKEYERKRALAKEMFMGLHAWRYHFEGMTFEAPLPKWATDSSHLDQVYQKRRNYELKQSSSLLSDKC